MFLENVLPLHFPLPIEFLDFRFVPNYLQTDSSSDSFAENRILKLMYFEDVLNLVGFEHFCCTNGLCNLIPFQQI